MYLITLIFVLIFKSSSSATSSNITKRDVDLLEVQNANQLASSFREAPLDLLQFTFDSMFAEDDWVWTFMTYSDDVRAVWIRELAHYMSSSRQKNDWKLHCLDAHATCQVNRDCAELYNDVIDSCSLNRARIFGDSNSAESIAFRINKRKARIVARRARRLRRQQCRNFIKKRLNSHTRGPLLIGRSASRPQILQRRPMINRKKLLANIREWMKAKRRKKTRRMPTLNQVVDKLSHWGGRVYPSVMSLMCENLEANCPAVCFESLRKLNNSIYSSLLFRCECGFQNLPRNLSNRVEQLNFINPNNLWDEKMCRHQKHLVDSCRPKIYRPVPGRRPGCTLVMLRCRRNRACYHSYRDVMSNCAGAIEGKKCPLNCTAAMAGLYSKQPGFFRCRPDGNKRLMWFKWAKNMGHSCNLKCAMRSEGKNDALTKC